MYNSKIEWVDSSWNPVMGCTKISTGCKNCYALAMIRRYAGRKGWPPDEHAVTLFPERLELPVRWTRPRRIFVCSMSDLFHEDVPFEFIAHVWRLMDFCYWHTFMVLTKRGERLQELDAWLTARGVSAPAPANVWLGVTIEEPMWSYRADFIRGYPRTFVSFEPMLGSFAGYPGVLDDIDWVICGAESGSQRRPFEMRWARDLKDQCVAAGIPFFFKQAHDANGRIIKMPLLDGRTWAQFPEFGLDR